MEVMRWEEGKKWQKKFDVIRERLTEKTGEIETLQKQVICLRELQNRYVYIYYILYLHNNTLAHGTVTNDNEDVGLHEYSC